MRFRRVPVSPGLYTVHGAAGLFLCCSVGLLCSLDDRYHTSPTCLGFLVAGVVLLLSWLFTRPTYRLADDHEINLSGPKPYGLPRGKKTWGRTPKKRRWWAPRWMGPPIVKRGRLPRED